MKVMFAAVIAVSCLANAAWAQWPSQKYVANPVWVKRPEAAGQLKFYPKEALANHVEGRTVLDCVIRGDGKLTCKVDQETPADAGFGAAALKMSAEFQMAPGSASKHVMLPIWFTLDY